MASKLVSAFRRGVARFQSSYRFRSSKNLGRGTASYISLSAMTACGYLWLKTNDDDHLTQISIRLPSHPFGSLMYFNQQGMAFSYVSSIRSNSLKDYHLEKAQSDVSIDSPTSSNFETGSSNHMGSCPNTDSSCLTRHSIADAAAKVSPAVVNLTVTQGVRGMFLGKAIGSGTIIDPNGIILTNAHVVAEFTGGGIAHKGKVVVTLQDGRSFDGEVINADFHTDIAVVRINTKVPLPAAKLGSSSKLRPGDWVIALGCPLFLQNTVTAGIISCVDRKSSDLGLGGVRREYLQTDCAINEGNSGGPLVNLDGEVIGINTMKVLAADGVSFAIPIDSVVNTVEQFKKHGLQAPDYQEVLNKLSFYLQTMKHKLFGRVVRPWLGLKMLDLNELIIAQLKERDSSFPDVTQGVLVSQVTPGSPADRAGFHSGDVVISFDGKPVKSIKQIVDTLGDKIGVAFKVTVKRANNTQVELTIVPEEASRNM